ncbi:MAG TPA: methyltransferase [Pyrinomonadaceae bacterium]|nr:methyltransferase [Pyrinomonadaceae bacterium]
MTVSPEPILQIASGFLAAKHLFVAAEIGLFEKLAEGPLTLDELAQRTGLPRRTLRITTDAMTALGIVERQGDRYSNSPAATAFLSDTGGPDLRPFLRFWNRLSYPRWMRLEEAIRTDEMIFGESSFSDQEQNLYSEGVEAVTAGTAHALAETYDFRRHQRLLDLGGGTASFLIPILSRFGNLQATLFDLPAVVSATRRRLAQTPQANHIRIVEGDFFRDPIPKGHDAVIIANIIHCFPADLAQELLRRVDDCVSVGARILLIDFWTNVTHTEPVFAALMAGEFLLTPGRGDVYSIEDAEGWFDQIGWRQVEHKPLAGPASLLVAEAA